MRFGSAVDGRSSIALQISIAPSRGGSISHLSALPQLLRSVAVTTKRLLWVNWVL